MENAYELKIDNKILKFLTIEGKIYFLKSNVKEMLEEEIEIGEEVSNCQYKELEVIEESMLYISNSKVSYRNIPDNPNSNERNLSNVK